MRPKVSVIVPIYNVEEYLPKCIESILNQTLINIEIILINDGSLDKSGEIANFYSSKDKRIKVIDKPNGGLSDARNWGMKEAHGEYISFLDSDDWIDSNMLKEMYEHGFKTNAEVIVSGKITEFLGEGYKIEDNFDKYCIAIKKYELQNTIFNMCELGLFNVVWNKIYKKDFIEEKGFRFQLDAMPAEDVVFNSQVFSEVKSLVVLNRSYYHYMKRDIQTYVNKYSPKIYEVSLNKFISFKKLFENLNLHEEKHKAWLNAVYMDGLSDCVINMYRIGSPLTFSKRNEFLKQNILSDSFSKQFINSYKPINVYQRIFKNFYTLNNGLLMTIAYDFLFFARRNFGSMYLKFRKKNLQRI